MHGKARPGPLVGAQRGEGERATQPFNLFRQILCNIVDLATQVILTRIAYSVLTACLVESIVESRRGCVVRGWRAEATTSNTTNPYRQNPRGPRLVGLFVLRWDIW